MAINEVTSIDVKTLPPFKRLIMTLGELPTSYLESMTYAELLMWFCNFLQEKVLPTINNNADALQDVITYLENIDLQDEVNNKLDEMAESGQLQEIIADYLNSKAVFGFDTVADMKLATNFVNGSYAETLGYHAKNDGGSALYKIRNITNNDVVDEMFIVELANDELIAELVIKNNVINAKQLGAYGDNTHDDSLVFKRIFEYVSYNYFYDSDITTNYTFKNTIEIPNGNYLIQNNNLLANIQNHSIFNLIINGNYSKLIFDGFTGSAFVNDDKFAGIEFNDLIFVSTNDSKERILFDNYSTGQTQNLKYNNCSFSGTWKYVNKLTGTNNNSEYLFNECTMNGSWTSFLYDEQATSSDQFLNYWFNNCRYWCSSNWINIKKGGHIVLNHCDISGYQPSVDTYLYEFGAGSVSDGVSVFIDDGSRYELKTSHAKVLYSFWDNGLIHFDNCDFSSQQGNAQIDKCFRIKSNTDRDTIRFTNCKMYGKFYIETAANKTFTSEVVLENCDISKTISDLVEFYTDYTNTPALRLINCMFRGDATNVKYNMLLKRNNANFNKNVLHRNVYTFDPGGLTSSTLKTYYKPYYLESVAFGKDHRTYDNNTTIKVKCLLGTITASSDTTHITVSENDFIHFRKDMNIEINGRANKVSNTNMNTKVITLTTADSSITLGETVYLIAYTIQSNAYFGQATSEEHMHWKLYNDLLYEASASTVGELMYEILE
ncbi:MAG: hypothetical protein J6T10_30745 [Methanobrevibacter sp.]|nr:hypothetical protein [Methanobrevibacter sp.]